MQKCILNKANLIYETTIPTGAQAPHPMFKWNAGTLTYSLANNTGDLPNSHYASIALGHAVELWQLRIANLKLKKVPDGIDVDVRIKFDGSDPEFGGGDGILAYTWYPSQKPKDGTAPYTMVINDTPTLRWSIDGFPLPAHVADPTHYPDPNNQNYPLIATNNLAQVMCHEFGHALGLEHITDCPQCCMYPYYHNDVALNDRDVSAIQALYGKRNIAQWIIDNISNLISRNKEYV